MRIALLTDGIYPYVLGGMQKHSYYLVKYLAKNEVVIDLYHTAFQNPGELTCFSEDERRYINSIFIPYPKRFKFPGHYLLEQISYSNLIFEKLILNSNIDFIYAQGFTGLSVVRRKDKIKAPIGVNFHGLEMFQYSVDFISKLKSYLFKFHASYILKKSDFVFSLGKKVTDIIKRLKVSSEKIYEMPIGIGEDWVSGLNLIDNNRPLTFLFVGRYERRKGLEELNKAIIGFSAENIEFLIVGDIPIDKRVSVCNVKYLGKISDQAELKKVYSISDVLICPSHAEGMPTVILEAMASGLAIIATDVGAVAELVSSENGILLESSNEILLKRAIYDFMALENTFLNQLKQNSIDKVKSRFLWETIITNLIRKMDYEGKII